MRIPIASRRSLVAALLVALLSTFVAAGPAVAHSRVLMLHPKWH